MYTWHFTIMAQTGRLDRLWDNFSASFRGDRSSDSGIASVLALGTVALLALVALVLVVRRLFGGRNPANGPWPLFRAAQRACGVRLVERFLLSRVARYGRLEHPTAMLLTSDLFEQRISAWLGHVPNAAMRAWAARRLGRARQSLFADVQSPARSSDTSP